MNWCFTLEIQGQGRSVDKNFLSLIHERGQHEQIEETAWGDRTSVALTGRPNIFSEEW